MFSSILPLIKNNTEISAICQDNYIELRSFQGKTILSAKKNSNTRAADKALNIEANGVIFDNTTRNILCHPGKCVNYKFRISDLRKLMANPSTRICETFDGTMITLYFADNAWKISTFKGCDVAQISIISSLTFADMLRECAGIDIATATLNPAYCYTIGVSHQSYHMFTRSNYAWFSHAVDLQTLNNTGEIKIITDVPQLSHLQTYHDASGITIDRMLELSRNSLQDYLDKKCPPLFGFLIRTAGLSHPHYYIESSLMQKIRNINYNYKECNTNTKIHYIGLNIYIYSKLEGYVRTMFPYINSELYCNYFKYITSEIISGVRNSGTIPRLLPISQYFISAYSNKIDIVRRDSVRCVNDMVIDPVYLQRHFQSFLQYLQRIK